MPSDPKAHGLPTHKGSAGQAHHPTRGTRAAMEEAFIPPEALDERQRQTSLKRKPAGPTDTMRSARLPKAPPSVPETDCAEPDEDPSPRPAEEVHRAGTR